MSYVYGSKHTDNRETLNVMSRAKCYEELKQRENRWWQAGQMLSTLKERQMFWYSDNSLIMWLVWQFVAYVVVAMLLMLISKLFNMPLSVWQYLIVVLLQTIVFAVALANRSRLASRLQNKIDEQELARAEAFSEMIILAADCLYPDVHRKAPITLQKLYEDSEVSFYLSSLHCLLQREVEAGRLRIKEQQNQADALLPPDLADDELASHASEITYISALTINS